MSQDAKTCWITGAGSGIGRELALRLARAGNTVYASGRDAAKLEDLVEAAGGNVIALPCDVTDDRAMATLFDMQGPTHLDLAILCAGTCEYIDLPDIDMDSMRRVLDTNFFGIANACVAALSLMENTTRTGHRPHIIGIGSLSSHVGLPRAEAYGASKAAMSYFLESLRIDLQGRVDVTVVYPGFVTTPMTAANDFPMPLLMPASKAADIILKRARKRPLTIAFPRRLHWLLRSMALCSPLWYKFIGPRLSRTGATT